VARDLVGSYDLTLTGGSFQGDRVAPGLPEPRSLLSSADGSYLQGSGAVPGFSGTAGTFLGWFTPTSATGSQGMFDSAPDAVGAVRIFTADGWANIRFEIGDNSGTSVAAPAGFVGRPHLICVAWDGGNTDPDNASTLRVYCDGVCLGGYNRSATPVSSGTQVGRINSSGFQTYRGSSQDVAVFSTGLSSRTIRRLYQAGNRPGRR